MLINADKNFFDKTQEMALESLPSTAFRILAGFERKKGSLEVSASGESVLFSVNAPDGSGAIDLRA